MGMPITIEIVNCHDKKLFLKIFEFFRQIDKKFSPYKPNSEVTLINCMRKRLQNRPDEEYRSDRRIREASRDEANELLSFILHGFPPQKHRENSEQRHDESEQGHMESRRHEEAERIDEPDEDNDERRRDHSF